MHETGNQSIARALVASPCPAHLSIAGQWNRAPDGTTMRIRMPVSAGFSCLRPEQRCAVRVVHFGVACPVRTL